MQNSSTLPDILCCVCSTVIKANAANMCVSCLKNQVNITEGITKEVTMHQCRGCLRYSRASGSWVDAPLESRELLAICLKKINGLTRVKLVDAGWIWTEPHSKRLKIKLTIQKEVMAGAILQQSFIVTFIVRNQQCDTCQASFCNQSWRAVVQVRQKVPHKRTFYFLEQLILKHKAHEKCSSLKTFPDGIDFYFPERTHALRFVDFLQETVPLKLKKAKKLISADNHSNTHNYKFTYFIDIAPVCKDDLVLLPSKTAASLGYINKVVLVSSVSSSIHVVDFNTLSTGEIDNEKFWKHPFKALCSYKSLTNFTVLDINAVQGRNGHTRRRVNRLVEVEVARNSDFGVNDKRFIVTSHLGNILRVGDIVSGYDLTTSVFNDSDLTDTLNERDIENMPSVVLVRKIYEKSSKRNFKLKTFEENSGQDYEDFLSELEGDKQMRSQINLYKKNNDDDGGTIPLNELLDDMAI